MTRLILYDIYTSKEPPLTFDEVAIIADCPVSDVRKTCIKEKWLDKTRSVSRLKLHEGRSKIDDVRRKTLHSFVENIDSMILRFEQVGAKIKPENILVTSVKDLEVMANTVAKLHDMKLTVLTREARRASPDEIDEIMAKRDKLGLYDVMLEFEKRGLDVPDALKLEYSVNKGKRDEKKITPILQIIENDPKKNEEALYGEE